MRKKLNEVKQRLEKLIEKMEEDEMLGPIAYVEEAIENLEHAMDEAAHY